MNQTNNSNQNVIPGNSSNIGGQQNFPPYQNPSPYPPNNYPQQQWQQPQQQQQQQPQAQPGQPVPPLPIQQQPQPVGTGVSPESPVHVKQPEQYIAPEVPVQVEKGQEGKDADIEQTAAKEEKGAKHAVEGTPDEKKFESPFGVYGYHVSQRSAALGKKSSSSKVKGNPSFAKTWLIVLLGRLLRLKSSEALEAS